jgi:hypothetical protein
VQQKVLQLVVDRIVVEDSRVIIEHVVPTGPVRLQPEHQLPGTQDAISGTSRSRGRRPRRGRGAAAGEARWAARGAEGMTHLEQLRYSLLNLK